MTGGEALINGAMDKASNKYYRISSQTTKCKNALWMLDGWGYDGEMFCMDGQNHDTMWGALFWPVILMGLATPITVPPTTEQALMALEIMLMAMAKRKAGKNKFRLRHRPFNAAAAMEEENPGQYLLYVFQKILKFNKIATDWRLVSQFYAREDHAKYEEAMAAMPKKINSIQGGNPQLFPRAFDVLLTLLETRAHLQDDYRQMPLEAWNFEITCKRIDILGDVVVPIGLGLELGKAHLAVLMLLDELSKSDPSAFD
jgi:hypothetical protein